MAKKKKQKKIRLEPHRHFRKDQRYGYRHQYTTTCWVESPPFIVNPRAELTHRVRHVTAFWEDASITHYAVDLICGGTFLVEGKRRTKIDDVLVFDPPTDRLLCQRCETVAAAMKLPTGDQLAGRHVHRGKLVPEQTCCQGK